MSASWRCSRNSGGAHRASIGARCRGLLLAAALVTVAGPSPAALTELADIVAISAGGFHTCGITTTGGVKCWGSNSSGQLGDGTKFRRTLPVDVTGLEAPVASLSAGQFHTCAVLATGGLKCWGSNTFGQVGASGTAVPTPVDALGLTSGIASVAAGHFHTCALTTTGGVKCWGTPEDNLLGGSPDVPALASGVAALAASGDYVVISRRFVFHYPSSCALTSGGGVQCWGYNSYGQLGDGTRTSRPEPLAVTGLASGVLAIAHGGKTGCALMATAGVKCWGYDYGTTPADVPGLASGVAEISVGEYHRCALMAGGGAKCWGDNTWGQLGTGASPGGPSPMDVPGLASGVAAVGAGERHGCALLATGGVRCWGDNYSDQAGNGGAAAMQLPPAAVLTGDLPRLANISTRAMVLTGDDVTIAGFAVQGTSPKTVVVRARGPSLSGFGIAIPLPNPVLQIFSGASVIASNDNWGYAPDAAAISAAGFAPADQFESAIMTTLPPGAYTAIMSGAGGLVGVGIVEVFELDNPQAPLANISTRGRVLTGDDVMIAGFVIQGDSPQEVIVRARGPSLAQAGIADPLANPVLQLYSGQTLIASNDDWGNAGDTTFTIAARGMAPASPLESAILITLSPGAYTAIVSGAGGATGVGIVEVFAQ